MDNLYTSATLTDLLSTVQGENIIFTNGCFDLLHPGHIDYLTKAKALGDALIVGLNSDQSVQSLKGSDRPINSEVFRASMLLALKPVDAVIIFEEDTPIQLLDQLKPSIHVKGGDYVAEELPEYTTVKKNGGDIKILPFLDGFSSTKLIERIKAIR